MAEAIDYSTVDSRVLGGTKDLLAVMKATKEITDWSVLALYFGIDEADYKRIQQNATKQSGNLQKDVINRWFDTGKATWAALVEHLCDDLVNKQGLAQKIAQEHSVAKPSQPSQPSQPSPKKQVQSAESDIWRKSPEVLDAHRLLKTQSNGWFELGQYLKLPNNDLQGLKRDLESNNNKLDSILNSWVTTECSDVTWQNLFDIVKDLQWITEAKAIKEFLKDDSTQKKYAKQSIWEPL